MAEEFYFDKRTQRYHRKSNNTFVGINELRSLVDDSISQSQDKALIITQKLLDKKISVGEWEDAIARIIKTQTIQHYKLGKPEINFRDYGIIGSRYLKSQYSRLRKFSYDIMLGTLSEAQIKARVNQYFSKTREAFEDGRRESHKDVRVKWERRILGVAEHCSDCIVYAAMSWQLIGMLPRPCDRCACKSNCKCRLEFSFSITKPAKESLLLSSWDWIDTTDNTLIREFNLY